MEELSPPESLTPAEACAMRGKQPTSQWPCGYPKIDALGRENPTKMDVGGKNDGTVAISGN